MDTDADGKLNKHRHTDTHVQQTASHLQLKLDDTLSTQKQQQCHKRGEPEASPRPLVVTPGAQVPGAGLLNSTLLVCRSILTYASVGALFCVGAAVHATLCVCFSLVLIAILGLGLCLALVWPGSIALCWLPGPVCCWVLFF